jgi:hypothetical protein
MTCARQLRLTSEHQPIKFGPKIYLQTSPGETMVDIQECSVSKREKSTIGCLTVTCIDNFVQKLPLLHSMYFQARAAGSIYWSLQVNHPQGYPKFWSHSFMADQDLNSLIHVFLGPAQMSTTLANNNKVNGKGSYRYDLFLNWSLV